MAHSGHLEKMGRELKCPICLSLLKSAVSLGCNHVFCNSCVMESMKTVSECPVCRVPFRRREIRPAPHMDNLVSVLKSMELAAGTNIFSTQVTPLVKNSENELSGGTAKKNWDAPETLLSCQGKPKRNRLSNKRQKDVEEAKATNSESCPSTMPTFPAKKRVHVKPYPVEETLIRPEKVSKLGDPNPALKNSRDSNRDTELAIDELGNPLLSPFFWLGEEDENAERQSGRHVSVTPLHDVPCFSDIKDGDDETPTKMTPTSKASVAEAFDSEMFEWTQRACSPELCSTPVKKQTASGNKLDPVDENECLEGSRTRATSWNEFPHNKSKIRTVNSREKFSKKKRQANKIRQKCVQSPICRTVRGVIDDVIQEVPIDFGDVDQRSNQDSEGMKNKNPPSHKRESTQKHRRQQRSLKWLKNQTGNSDAAILSEETPTGSTKAKNQNEEKRNAERAEKSSKRGKGANPEAQRKRIKVSKGDAMAKLPKAALANSVNETEAQNQELCRRNSNPPVPSCEESKNGECFSDGQGGIAQQKQLSKSNAQKRMNHQTGVIAVANDAVKMAISVNTAMRRSNETVSDPKSESVDLAAKRTRKPCSHTIDSMTLRRCESIHFQLQCAFCQSTDNTEISGRMMHYFNGKPVDADYNGGVNVIHAHKHCLEWAPNVYFEDDLAINLTAELARSRRIKCCCCGLRGAALGCYEKSCRKSFHYTCAKLVAECHWDNGNFVMLCPVHASSKLPLETFDTQRQSRKTSTPKGSSQASFVRRAGHDMSRMWTWPSGTPCKWVLCCSALSAAEKEIVSKFAASSGVVISNTWSSTVTHVIASTDKDGACRRTLKFLMAILNGKWILRIDWIKACMEAMEPVNEEKYEIAVDIHGITGGPRLGRLRAINEQPRLFDGFEFYFIGEYTSSYKGYLQDLVIAAGGTVLHRKPISKDQKKFLNDSSTKSFIIYSLESPERQNHKGDALMFNRRRAEAEALADASGGKVATNTWIIDSIAACKLQPLS